MNSALTRLTISAWGIWGSQALYGLFFVFLGLAVWNGALPVGLIQQRIFENPDHLRILMASLLLLFGAGGVIGFAVFFPNVAVRLGKAREIAEEKKWAKAQLKYVAPFPICWITKVDEAGEPIGETTANVVQWTNPWKPFLRADFYQPGSPAESVEVLIEPASKSLTLVSQDGELGLVVYTIPAALASSLRLLEGSTERSSLTMQTRKK